MNAGVRALTKKDIAMMDGSGGIQWRFIGSPDISVRKVISCASIFFKKTQSMILIFDKNS
jgi:hypothetical protein